MPMPCTTGRRDIKSEVRFYFGCVVILVGVGLACFGKDYVALVIGAGLICVIIDKFDKASLLKFGVGGFEVQQKIAEAKSTIDELRSLATVLGKFAVQSLQSQGRWGGGMSMTTKDKLTHEVIVILQQLHVEPEHVEAVRAIEFSYTSFDYAHWVTEAVPSNFTAEQSKAWTAFFEERNAKGIGGEPSPDELETFLTANGFLTEEGRERLLDYRHWLTHREHRRSVKWFGR